jgi:Fic family protein
MTGTRIYNIWKGIKKRCYNNNSSNYKNYGERNIIMCEDWIKDFMNFYNWSIDNGYNDTLSIDRKDNDGNYEPNNCRWTTSKAQMNNSRINHKITLNGETKLLHEWSKIIGITPSNVLRRLSENLTDEEILSEKYYSRNKRINIDGKEYTIKEIAGIANVHYSTIHHRINTGIYDNRLFEHRIKCSGE